MNGEAKPGKSSSKKGIKSLPALPDVNAIFSTRPSNKQTSTYGILPVSLPIPPPIGPSLSNSGPFDLNQKIRSPVDSTHIMINGKITNIDESIENRIGEGEVIRPITPPLRQIDAPRIYEEASSPTMIPNNVRIISTPPRPIDATSFLRTIPIPPPPPPPYEYAESVAPSDDDKSVISENNMINNAKTPSTTTASTTSTPSTAKKKNIRSLLPVFNKSNKTEYPAIPQEELNPLSPVNIPVPVFNTQTRVVSPIQTIGGPKSPSPVVRPVFNGVGKSFTPQKISPRPPTVRAKTPPPIFRNTQQEDTGYSPVPQRDYSEFGGMKPDFGGLTKDQESYLRQEFKMKFGILRANYPQWNVIEPSDSLTIQQMHDLYNHYLHQIMVSRETSQYKVYMVIFLMVIEVIGVKFLKLNMSGYTMSQLKIMNRYDTLFTELGEKWLVSGSSNWPVEARIIMMMMFNAIIFLVVRYLCSWLGVDGLADTLQGWIDGMMNGPTMNIPAVPTGGSSYAPTAPAPTSTGAPGASDSNSSSNPLDNIAGAFSNFFSNNAGNIGEKIAQIGTMFSGKIQNNNATQATIKTAQQQASTNAGAKKINKKKLFED